MNLNPLDVSFYKSFHADLAQLSDDEARAHFGRWGLDEGRPCAAAAVREHFLKLLPEDGLVLEIGPFMSPVVRGPHVRYVDVLDTAGLRARALEVGGDPDGCPLIHYPSPDLDLGVIPDRFAAVVSSHNIEHQPDLVRHLAAIEGLLEPGGRYFMMVPDKRFCFDHFLPETSIADVMSAYAKAPRRHDLGHVIEHWALTTHNDSERHWAGDHGAPTVETNDGPLRHAIKAYGTGDGPYIDVHAWKFTPKAFATTFELVHRLGLTRLRPTAVFNTPRPRNEFCAILTLDDGA